MDSSAFNDLYKGFVAMLVVAAVVGIAIWELAKFIFHHIHVFWR